MGVCRQEVRRKSGRWFAQYIAEWPKSDDTEGSASFSVNLYGEEDAFELTVAVGAKDCGSLVSQGLF